jgi:RNA polymerase sigma-70 factor (ECF subfamily)
MHNLNPLNQVMPETSCTLLERLRDGDDDQAWRRLVELYTPLIQGWLRRYALPAADVDDLTQEVMTALVREMPEFRRQRAGSFRHWLKTITINRLRGFWRARNSRPVATGDSDMLKMLEQLEDPASQLSSEWNREHDRHVAQRLLQMIEVEFEPSTWRAFQRQVQEGARAAQVADELGISVNAVLLAKSRVLRRLRQEIEGFF